MNKLKKNKENWHFSFVVPVIVGLGSFLMVIGPKALNPTNISWLNHGDPATHYLGWVFFRATPWSFPIGLNPRYGLEISNSIVYSDSNPLFAISFKIFSQFLPETFQYFGIWLLACFVLQAGFAYRLVGLITKNTLIQSLCSGLFVFAPPMIWRLNGHLTLVGHFIVLASLYLALLPSPKRRVIGWTTLLVVASLTHAYLFVMAGSIWVADILGRQFKKTLTFRKAVSELLIVLGAISISCWQAGYFTVSEAISSGGFGLFRMNLLSLLDSDGWSYVLRDIPGGVGDYEGFNFLGLGMIFLGICALPAIFISPSTLVRSATTRPFLLAMIFGLTAFALSNKVGIASFSFEIPVSNFFLNIANNLRSSGRLFWPVFYAIYTSIILVTIRGYKRPVCTILIGISLVLQILDTSNAWLILRKTYMVKQSSTWETKMVSSFWAEAASKYSKVRGFNMGKDFKSIASYSAAYGLGTDSAYLARVSRPATEKLRIRAERAVLSGSYESDTLYILDPELLSKVDMIINENSDLLAQIDGFTIIAPGWKKCTTCSIVPGETKLSDHLPSSLKIGDRISFNLGESGQNYLVGGWSQPEPWGTWSDGKDAVIKLHVTNPNANRLVLEVNPLVSSSHPHQRVEVRVNDSSSSTVTLSAISEQRFEVSIPPEVQEQLKYRTLITLQLHLPDAVRPVDIGISNDKRELAIGLVALSVQ